MFKGIRLLYISSFPKIFESVAERSENSSRVRVTWTVGGVSWMGLTGQPLFWDHCLCLFTVGGIRSSPNTDHIWICGHIAEPGARAPIHQTFPWIVFLLHICSHMQGCLVTRGVVSIQRIKSLMR